MLFLLGLASASIVMMSLMDGLSLGSFEVQRSAILRTKSISSWTCLHFPAISGSSTSSEKLQKYYPVTIYVTLFIHLQCVSIFCRLDERKKKISFRFVERKEEYGVERRRGEHGGSIPPQRPALPIRSLGLMVISMPLLGRGPSSLLYDKLNISRAGELPKLSGIFPTRELFERSRMASVGIVAMAFGISPANWLFLRFNLTSFSHEAMLWGISPENWLFDRSSTEREGQSWN
nr:hypothetical protein TorRG33x02_009900 [Ipomoea trifida]